MQTITLPVALEYCTGCSLCAQICPYGAIRMENNAEGFLVPVIDQDACCQCGTCSERCPINIESIPHNHAEKQEVFACQAREEGLLMEATAGGLFPVAAQWVLNQGGVVFGAAYDKQMRVVHCAAHDMEGVRRFNGSKYVQSDIGRALREARDYLINDKIVLFSGTPCQIDALNQFCLDISTQKLYTIDVVCYGVPSPKLFRMYLDTVERMHAGVKVVDFRFRDKHRYGWSHTTVITLQNDRGKQTVLEEPDFRKIPYYRMFGARNCYRKSCYRCKYNTLERRSDITTGNFWGIEKMSSAFDCRLGVSMAVINTGKGKTLFENIESNMVVERRTVEDAERANDALVKDSIYPEQRDAIYECLNRRGLEAVIKKYYTVNTAYFIRKAIRKAKKIFGGRVLNR